MTGTRLCAVLLGFFLGIGTAAPGFAGAAPAGDIRLLTSDAQVAADGTSVITVHVELHAGNDAAAMQIGQTSVPYDAAMEDMQVIEAHTEKKDGTKIPVTPAAIYEQSPPGAATLPMFTGQRVKVIVFPQFAAGDTAVYTIRAVTKQPYLPGQYWYNALFPRTVAYDEVRGTLTAPKSLPLYVESYGIDVAKRESGSNVAYSWHYSAPTPEAAETAAVSPLARTPRLFFSTFKDYAALGNAYAAQAAPKMVPTTKIRALADGITSGITERRAQAEAIYAWVSGHIRYVGVELGTGSLVPHDAETILSNGYGDCKDHAVLLSALLKAKGIESESVLINGTNDYTLAKVPTFVQLNHAITYLPEFGVYLDSDAVVAPFGVLPLEEYGKPIVRAVAGHSSVSAVPLLPPEIATQTLKTVAQVDRSGRLTGTSVTTATGPLGINLRMDGLGVQVLGPDNAAARQLAALGYGNDATGHIDADPPMTPAPSYTIKGSFTAGGWADKLGGNEILFLPGGLRLLGLSGDGPMGNFHPDALKPDAEIPCYSAHASEDLSLKVPDGVTFARVPDDTHVRTANIRFDAHWSLSGNTMAVHRDFESTIDQPLCTAGIRKANAAALKEISDSYNTNLSLVAPASGGAEGSAGNTLAPPKEPSKEAQLDSKYRQIYEEAKKAATQEQDPAKAIRLLTEILAAKDLPANDVGSVYLARGAVDAETGQYRAAISDLNAAIARMPGSIDALYIRATAYMAMHDYKAALKDLDALISIAPNNANARGERATLRMQYQNYAGAVEDMTAFLEQFPGNAEMRQMRAVLYEKLGRYNEATVDFERAKTGSERNSIYANELCTAYARSRKPAAALKPCGRVLESEPYSADALSGLGIAYYRLGQYDKALLRLTSAARTYPNNAEYLYARGAAEVKLGNASGGENDMSQAEKMSPGIGKRMARFGVAP